MNSETPAAKRRYLALAVLSPLTILLIWILVTSRGAVPPTILPSPLAVATSFLDMIQRGYSRYGPTSAQVSGGSASPS